MAPFSQDLEPPQNPGRFSYTGLVKLDYGISDGTNTVTTILSFNLTQNFDGISSAVENTVPSTEGGAQGDGNGDGILDSQQNDVASLPTLDTNVWATLDSDTTAVPGVVITEVQNNPVPQDLPAQASLPYGVFSFNLESLASGATVPMSIYLTGTWAVNPTNQSQWVNSDTGDVISGYWKQSAVDLNWYNIATSIAVVGGKLKIDFNLTDGDWTDKDGLVNGIIVDPGAPGFNNNVPVAADDTGSMDEDGVFSFKIEDILSNDSDLDNDNLIPALVASPINGILAQLADGSFSYTPNPDFNGTDSFTYKVNDGTEDSNIATVTITVNPVNDTPTGPATGTLADGTEDVVYPVLETTLLQGFADVDVEDTLNVINLSSANGTFAPTTTGWNFTPAQDYNGPVTFAYQVSDGMDGIVDVSRTFNLSPVNDIPMGSPAGELAHGQEDTPYTILQSDLINGYSDADLDVLSVTGLTINHGTLSAFNSSTNSWTFTPDKDFNGTVNLSYGITDGKGSTVSGIDRSFIVDPVNDVPKAGDDFGTVFEDSSVTVGFDAFLANDFDADGSDKTIIGIDANGTKCSVS